MPPLLQLQKLPGKGNRGWEKKCLCVEIWLTRSSRVREKKKKKKKKRFGAFYSTGNKLLLIARHILTTGLQKGI